MYEAKTSLVSFAIVERDIGSVAMDVSGNMRTIITCIYRY